MKRHLMILCAMVLTCGTCVVSAQELTSVSAADTREPASISVRGYATRLVTPDMIYLDITIDENDTKGKVSIAELESQMLSTLNGVGVDTKKNLVTKSIDSNLSNFRREETRTTKSYELLVGDAKTMTKVYDELNKIGVSQISIDRTSHSDIEEIKREVKAQSVVNAQADARAMAKAIGQDIGKAYEIGAFDQPSV
ncbi:MAG: SIMPL domain-containing protein, partial [Rikenellaceae bacterium]